MVDITKAGSYQFAGHKVWRMGYGAMQLAGPGVFGEPQEPENARKVLQQVVAQGVNHIDTSDFYGPHVTNKLIKQALHPYADDLLLVTKVGARRDAKGNWLPAFSAEELIQAIEQNCENLGLEAIEVVNLRAMFAEGPAEGSLEQPLTVLAQLQQRGLIRHIGLSNVTMKQLHQAQSMIDVACVQNMYNVLHRHDDPMIDELAQQRIPFVPFFPLGGFTPIKAQVLNDIAARLHVSAMQVALAWLLQRSPNILLIPGTASSEHLQQNLAAAELLLPADALEQLNLLAA